jgi:hypothetical protein
MFLAMLHSIHGFTGHFISTTCMSAYKEISCAGIRSLINQNGRMLSGFGIGG